eukprot:1241899-Rhodomonas_salina.1
MEGAQREDRAKRGREKGGERREGGTEGDYLLTQCETTTTSSPLEILADAQQKAQQRLLPPVLPLLHPFRSEQMHECTKKVMS